MDAVKKSEAKVAYVDDVNFYAEGADFEEAYLKLDDMMARVDGCQDWSKNHNSRYEMSKLKVVRFTRWWIHDPDRLGKTIPKPWPDLMLARGAPI